MSAKIEQLERTCPHIDERSTIGVMRFHVAYTRGGIAGYTLHMRMCALCAGYVQGMLENVARGELR